ncbi:hypothetical protein NQ038_07585 [Brevibacterium sp. 50QC2O2]|uniref:hypothetical protein n=1 Tax=Brevibacterium sp. 50QC2O2 TaxID=2968459 RepID=UPI00211CD9B2|nr:hypothetical protein [Brevibacterium sp. 50QC2O2]MCQ9388507.1 hypothetical protein [Brevibacterium sp. 50QC2O2]
MLGMHPDRGWASLASSGVACVAAACAVAPAEAVGWYYRPLQSWSLDKADPADGFLESAPLEAAADRPECAPEALLWSAMIGIPAEATARIGEHAVIGNDEYSFWAGNSISVEEKKASFQVFIDAVMPNFR